METSQGNTQGKKLQHLTLGVALLLAASLVLLQPIGSYAASSEAIPAWDNCTLLENQPEDNIVMNTQKYRAIVKTVHAEKELFECYLAQSNFELPVIMDVTTYVELYENISTRNVIAASAYVVNCMYSEQEGRIIDCDTYAVPRNPVPVGNSCTMSPLLNPMEMNTVKAGRIFKTIEAEKKVFLCEHTEGTLFVKKVDIIAFTETYENVETQQVVNVQVHTMRCVVLITDNASGDDARTDATVESCILESIEI